MFDQNPHVQNGGSIILEGFKHVPGCVANFRQKFRQIYVLVYFIVLFILCFMKRGLKLVR